MSRADTFEERCQRMEGAATDLIKCAESFANPGSAWDVERRRYELLKAARRYGRAINNLRRPIS